MMDRDELIVVFERAKDSRMALMQKKECLNKNRSKIMQKDGSIPEKYQKAFKKLENEVELLTTECSAAEKVLLDAVSVYVPTNATGNLYFEKNIAGTEFFLDTYKAIQKKNQKRLASAITSYDLNRVDKVTQDMREEFISLTFSKYKDYAKNLSLNAA